MVVAQAPYYRENHSAAQFNGGILRDVSGISIFLSFKYIYSASYIYIYSIIINFLRDIKIAP